MLRMRRHDVMSVVRAPHGESVDSRTCLLAQGAIIGSTVGKLLNTVQII